MKTAFLHYGGPFTADPKGPRLTIETEVKEDPTWWQKRGLSFTASGYGSKIPTRYKVKVQGRWCRVYCCIYSNSGTCYVVSKGKPLATVDIY
jgi:hypothetical protein